MQVILSRLFEKEKAYKGHKWSFEPIEVGELTYDYLSPYNLQNRDDFIAWIKAKYGQGEYLLQIPHLAHGKDGKMRNSLKTVLDVIIKPHKRRIRVDRWRELIWRER